MMNQLFKCGIAGADELLKCGIAVITMADDYSSGGVAPQRGFILW
jgi:hypothetical protein